MAERLDAVSPVEYQAGDEKKTRWVRCGSAWVKDDGKISVLLDALPVNGKLILMKPKAKDDIAF